MLNSTISEKGRSSHKLDTRSDSTDLVDRHVPGRRDGPFEALPREQQLQDGLEESEAEDDLPCDEGGHGPDGLEPLEHAVLPEVLVSPHHRSVRVHHRVPPARRREKSINTNKQPNSSSASRKTKLGSDEMRLGVDPSGGSGMRVRLEGAGRGERERGGRRTHRRITKGGQRERSASMEV